MTETLDWVRKFLSWIAAAVVQVLINIRSNLAARRAVLSVDHEIVTLCCLKLEFGVRLG